MKTEPHKVIKFFFGTTFLALVNVASIIGLVALFVSNKEQTIVALLAFVGFLIILLLRFFWVTEQFLRNKSAKGFDKLSTSVKYYTTDGKIIIYELKKFIQCKKILMDTHEHVFYWSGTKVPIITSETMEFEKIGDAPNGFKNAIFKYKTPLTYNNVFVAHIRMEIDDTDKLSSTYVEQFVREPMQLISFKVQLLYKKGNSIADARLVRKVIDSHTPFEHVKSIPFDKKISSYEHNLFDPFVGYTYRLEWNR